MMKRWESGGLEPLGARDHARGPQDAPVTLVMYGDYECPYCGEAHPVLKELQERVGERARFVFRHFPLNSVHPRARRAAQAAEAAASQGRFWEMHDLLYERQYELDDEDLPGLAIGKIGGTALNGIDSGVRQQRDVEIRGLLGFVGEPQAGRDLGHWSTPVC